MIPRRWVGRFRRVGRRPDHWSSPHERAMVRAAERLDRGLRPKEATWLNEHLAGCDGCRAVAEAYVADRLSLRQLRDDPIQPPRDLWARTAAGIERESAALDREIPPRRRRAASAPALGALSGLAVVGVVVVATAISGGWFEPTPVAGPTSRAAIASQDVTPQPTAIVVEPGKVRWLGATDDGMFAYNVANIHAVCPFNRRPDCVPLEDRNARPVTLTATPKYVFQSPVGPEAVVVGTDANGADAVIVVALPNPDAAPSGGGSPLDSDSIESPDPVGTATPTPTPIAVPSATLSLFPSDPLVSADPGGTAVAPSDPAGSPSTGSSSPEPPSASEPPAGSAVAIITDVTIVGRAAAYSPDGAWFAFSARPAGGSAGPDIYVWHVGDPQARALTTDHSSVFASWVGANVLGSRLPAHGGITSSPSAGIEPSGERASASPDPSLESPQTDAASPSAEASAAVETTAPPHAPVLVEVVPETFLLDPWTGTELARLDAEWQPAVDPTGLAVVAWQGTVGLGEDGRTPTLSAGTLVIHPYRGPLVGEGPHASPSPVVSPLPSGSALLGSTPAPTPTPTPTPSSSSDGSGLTSPSPTPQVAVDFPTQPLISGPVTDFDVRWDETGSWLAIWIVDPLDPGLGRLSLLRFDRTTGLVSRPVGAPQEVTALPGFSIAYGRLAWASPPGQEGEGTRIQIAAWTDNEVGAIESIPVDGAIVVQ